VRDTQGACIPLEGLGVHDLAFHVGRIRVAALFEGVIVADRCESALLLAASGRQQGGGVARRGEAGVSGPKPVTCVANTHALWRLADEPTAGPTARATIAADVPRQPTRDSRGAPRSNYVQRSSSSRLGDYHAMWLYRDVAKPVKVGVIGRSVSYIPPACYPMNAKAIDNEIPLARAHLLEVVAHDVLGLGARHMATVINLAHPREAPTSSCEGASPVACGRRAKRGHDR
jgi:hypothetical protein